MFLAALLIFLLATYHLGTRTGAMCGGAAAGLFFLATVVPALSTLLYCVVGAGVAGICWLGPRTESKRPKWNLTDASRQGMRLWRKLTERGK